MMKIFTHCLLLVASVMASGSIMAQSTLTAANTSPVPGESYYNHHCDTAHNEGASGAGITWNFSSLIVTSTDTSTFYACSGTYDCARFPGANMAQTPQGVSSESYYASDASKLSFVGVYIPSILFADTLQEPRDVYRFPYTYNDTYTDSFMMHTASQYQFGHVVHTCDGYGTLILPSGTFTNALREHITETYTDSTVGTPPSVVHNVKQLYHWIVPGSRIVLSLDYSNSLAAPITKKITLAETFAPTGIPLSERPAGSVTLSPNPMNSFCTLTINTSEPMNHCMLTISDPTGRTVRQLAINSPSTTISRDGLCAGMYFYAIYNGGTRIGGGKMVIE
jgi:hypothetical protein